MQLKVLAVRRLGASGSPVRTRRKTSPPPIAGLRLGNRRPQWWQPLVTAAAPCCLVPGQEFILPDDEWVTIQPLATDNVSMDRVEFYVNNRLVGSSSVAPFTYQWVIRGAVGTHSIYAIAYDAAGNSTRSDPVGIQVVNSGD